VASRSRERIPTRGSWDSLTCWQSHSSKVSQLQQILCRATTNKGKTQGGRNGTLSVYLAKGLEALATGDGDI
jgi:hypothetical protein